MCIFYDQKNSKAVQKKLQTKGYIVGYKIVIISADKMCAVGPYTRIPLIPDERGYIKSNSNVRCNSKHYQNQQISRGIHLYTNQKIAGRSDNNTLVVPVRCHAEDFIGADRDPIHVVFKKVQVDKIKFTKEVNTRLAKLLRHKIRLKTKTIKLSQHTIASATELIEKYQSSLKQIENVAKTSKKTTKSSLRSKKFV